MSSASLWRSVHARLKRGFIGTVAVRTGSDDLGTHAVCVQMSEEFLEFSRARGNDLSTPRPEFGFPGLKPGDRWCLCAQRWQEAHEAGLAPRVVLTATDEAALRYVALEDLKLKSLDLS